MSSRSNSARSTVSISNAWRPHSALRTGLEGVEQLLASSGEGSGRIAPPAARTARLLPGRPRHPTAATQP